MELMGTIVSYDAGTRTAVVQARGSLTAYLTGVRTARNIADAEMVAGRNVLLVRTGPAGVSAHVVVAVWV